MALTNRQKRFADEYLTDLNATQAAVRAGYSGKTAGSIGSENLRKPEMKAYIAQRMAEKEAQLIAKQDEILQYITAVMRGETESEVLCAAGRVRKKPDEKERLKAAELLGRYHALWTDKTQVSGDLDFSVRIDYGGDPDAG